MAKTITTPKRRTVIGCPFYEGFLDEMPQEAKDKMKAEKPELHKQLFETK